MHAIGHDQRKARQLRERQRRALACRRALARPARRRRLHQAQHLLEHGNDVEFGRRVGVVQQREVDAAGGDPFGDVRGEPLDDRQPRARQLAAERVDQRSRELPAQTRRQPDHDAADRLVALRAHVVACVRDVLQDRDRVLEQPPTGVGQLDAAAVAQQQRFAQVGLERTHLAAQRRLREPEQPRRAAEAAQLGDLHEVLELAKIHRCGSYPSAGASVETGRTRA